MSFTLVEASANPVFENFACYPMIARQMTLAVDLINKLDAMTPKYMKPAGGQDDYGELLNDATRPPLIPRPAIGRWLSAWT